MLKLNKKLEIWIDKINEALNEYDEYVNQKNWIATERGGEIKNCIVIDEPVIFVNHKNFNKSQKWMLYIKEEVSLEKAENNYHKVKVEFDRDGLRKKISALIKRGYKVRLFSDLEDKSLKRLGAIRGNKIKMNLERDFMKVIIE